MRGGVLETKSPSTIYEELEATPLPRVVIVFKGTVFYGLLAYKASAAEWHEWNEETADRIASERIHPQLLGK